MVVDICAAPSALTAFLTHPGLTAGAWSLYIFHAAAAEVKRS
jgi:hypothetical protein